jgi:hypothetical protein
VPVNIDPCRCRLCVAFRAGEDPEPFLHNVPPPWRYQDHAAPDLGSAWRMIGDDTDEPPAGVYRPVAIWREQEQQREGAGDGELYN